MTYEIPQKLEYKEKIIFGLTFEQLAYALLFFVPALAIFLKTSFNIWVKGTIATILITIGMGFMFLNFKEQAKNILLFAQMKKLDWKTNKIQQFVGIIDIKNDTITHKKKKIAILKVEPINFPIKPKDEQEIITLGFKKFLNALDFPLQIMMDTLPLDLHDYFKTLGQNTTNEKEAFEAYKAFLSKIITTGKIMNRHFYVIIKEQHNLEIQIDVCTKRLEQLYIKVKRLNTDELYTLFAGFYETKNKGTSLDKIFPDIVENNVRYVKINNTFQRTIVAKDYPRLVEAGFLDKIVTAEGDFDFTIHIEPYPVETMMINLNRELQKQRADLYAASLKQAINPSLEIQYEDTRKILEALQKGQEKLFNISLYINCRARSLKELDLLTKRIEAELNSIMILPHVPAFRMLQGVQSIAPVADDVLQIKRNLTSSALSAFFPFTSPFLHVDETGVWFGMNKNNIPIIRDIFKLYNANGVVLASSGGGKSYFTKLMISRLLLNNTKVMVIDPQAEYVGLVKQCNGQLITISRDSSTIINPLDLMGHDYDEKKLTLLELLPVMIGQTSEIQKAVLDKALTAVYQAKGITNDSSTWRKEPPLLGDLLAQLKQMAKHTTKIEAETYRSLINRLEMYVSGVFSFLNKQTNLDFNNRFVCFNIGDMPEQVKPVIMFLILDYVYMKMKKDIERKLLVIDEAWSLLQRSEDEGYIFKIVKTCRKFNLGLLLITQDVGDLVKGDAGKALLNNSEYTLLLRQKPSIIEQVEKTFHLSQHEKERLLTASTGEGILIMNNEHSEISILASPEEHTLITTNADERLMQERAKAKEIVTTFEKPTVDYAKGWFKKKTLKQEEIKDLLKQGYQESVQIGLFGGRAEEYLLKPRYNESAEHFFVVKVIEEYLQKQGVSVELFVSANADLVFEVKGKKIAVEVETGKKYDNDRKQLDKKLEMLAKMYGEDWFFVVTDWTYKEKYQSLGKTYVRKEVPAILKKQYFSQVSNSAVIDAESKDLGRFEVQNAPLLDHQKSETMKPTEENEHGTRKNTDEREYTNSGNTDQQK